MGKLAPLGLFLAGLVALIILTTVASNPAIGLAFAAAVGLAGLVAFATWLRNYELDHKARRQTFQATMTTPASLADGQQELTYLLTTPQNHDLALRALVFIVGQWLGQTRGHLSPHAVVGLMFGQSGGPDYRRLQAFAIAVMTEARRQAERKRNRGTLADDQARAVLVSADQAAQVVKINRAPARRSSKAASS